MHKNLFTCILVCLLLALTGCTSGAALPTGTPTATRRAATPQAPAQHPSETVSPTVTRVPPTSTPTPIQWPSASISVKNAAQLMQYRQYDEASGVLFAPNGLVLAMNTPNGLAVFDAQRLEALGVVTGVSEYASLTFSQDGLFFAATLSQEGKVGVWDAARLQQVKVFEGLGAGCCQELAFLPTGRWLAVVAGIEFSLWDFANGSRLALLPNVQRFHVSPDGKTLALEAANDLAVTLWDVNSRTPYRTLRGFETAAPFYRVLFSPDWKTVLWNSRGLSQWMDFSSGKLGEQLVFEQVMFSPDSRWLAASDPGWYGDTYIGKVFVLPVGGDTAVQVLQFDGQLQPMCAFAADSRLLACVSGAQLVLWDAPNGQKLARYDLPDTAYGVSFSPDGHWLAVQVNPGAVLLWAVED